MQIIVRDNNVDQALRALKKKLQREGVYREMKLRRHYEKPVGEARPRACRRDPSRPQARAQARRTRRGCAEPVSGFTAWHHDRAAIRQSPPVPFGGRRECPKSPRFRFLPSPRASLVKMWLALAAARGARPWALAWWGTAAWQASILHSGVRIQTVRAGHGPEITTGRRGRAQVQASHVGQHRRADDPGQRDEIRTSRSWRPPPKSIPASARRCNTCARAAPM